MKEVYAVVQAITQSMGQVWVTWSRVVEPPFAGWRRADGIVAMADGRPVGTVSVWEDANGAEAALTLRTPSGVRRVSFEVGRFPVEAARGQFPRDAVEEEVMA